MVRQWMWGTLALALSGCCCDFTKKETYADVPLTLAAAKKLEKSGTTVVVTRRTKQAGGGGGCNSAVCVILLPIFLYDAVFPETWDEVVVTTGDEVLLSASYTTGGELIHAQHLKDGVLYETRFIVLKALGKKAYVDSAKVVNGERVALPLSSQHDFIQEERKYLERTTDPEKRAQAILEAALVLEKEGFDFAIERLSSADEPEATRAEVIRGGCRNGVTPGFKPLLPAAMKGEGAQVKVALIDCAESGTPEREAALLAAIPSLCSGTTPPKLLREFHTYRAAELSQDESMRARAEAAGQACPAGGRRGLINLWLARPVTDADLDALLADPEVMKFAYTALRQSEGNQRKALVGLIATEADGSATMLRRLAADEVVLEPELLEVLGARYLKRTGLLQLGDRHTTLELFEHARASPDGPARVAPLLARFATAANAEKDPKRKAMLEAVRVLLGDTSRISAASAGLETPLSLESPSLDAEIVAFSLFRAGCSKEVLEAAATKKTRVTTCKP